MCLRHEIITAQRAELLQSFGKFKLQGRSVPGTWVILHLYLPSFLLVKSCKWGVGNNLGTHKDCLNLCLVSISLVLLKEKAVSQTSGWSEIMDDVKACKIICMIHHQTHQVQPGWSMWFLQASFLRIILQQIQCNVTRTSGCSPRLWPHCAKAKAKTCLGWLEQLDNMYSILVYYSS